MADMSDRPVVVADLEGTLTAGETWRGIAAWMAEQGRRSEFRRFLLPRMPQVLLARVGAIERQPFRDRWIRDFARFLRGMDGAALDGLSRWVMDHELWPKRRVPVIAELEGLAAFGNRLVLASGTYQPMLAAFAARVGATALGTELEMADGRATGRLAGVVGTATAKAARLHVALGGVMPERAYGDSAADIPMLEWSRVAVAVHPDAELARVAASRGWRVLVEGGATAG